MFMPFRRSSSSRFLAAACRAAWTSRPRVSETFATFAASGSSSVIVTVSPCRRSSACTTSRAELRIQTHPSVVMIRTLMQASPEHGPGPAASPF